MHFGGASLTRVDPLCVFPPLTCPPPDHFLSRVTVHVFQAASSRCQHHTVIYAQLLCKRKSLKAESLGGGGGKVILPQQSNNDFFQFMCLRKSGRTGFPNCSEQNEDLSPSLARTKGHIAVAEGQKRHRHLIKVSTLKQDHKSVI